MNPEMKEKLSFRVGDRVMLKLKSYDIARTEVEVNASVKALYGHTMALVKISDGRLFKVPVEKIKLKNKWGVR